ncbi:hypothetical protein AVEN_206161-1 [Araneus ventricosus]|uniref:Uncharacterized protein n=1 Tax=Araneus ventricosus TaxID=182803 RepID=A0A4Y2W7E7_ARAVE|nr:hypothetical protein AVEN_206161-1 [Araneus ventricosus]
MDSKIQMKKTSATGATGCKQPGKKKAKEREFSVYPRWRYILQLPQAGSQLRLAKHDRYRQHGDQRRAEWNIQQTETKLILKRLFGRSFSEGDEMKRSPIRNAGGKAKKQAFAAQRHANDERVCVNEFEAPAERVTVKSESNLNLPEDIPTSHQFDCMMDNHVSNDTEN